MARRKKRTALEEREALVTAPFGTPGLAELGLTDPEYSDLLNLGPRAKEEVLARRKRYEEFMLGKIQGFEAEHARPGEQP